MEIDKSTELSSIYPLVTGKGDPNTGRRGRISDLSCPSNVDASLGSVVHVLLGDGYVLRVVRGCNPSSFKSRASRENVFCQKEI